MGRANTAFLWEGIQLLKQRREKLLSEEICQDSVPHINAFKKKLKKKNQISIYVKISDIFSVFQYKVERFAD